MFRAPSRERWCGIRALLVLVLLTIIIISTSTLAGSESAAVTHEWSPEIFPALDRDDPACRVTKSMRICDPDMILSVSDLDMVDQALVTETSFPTPCSQSEEDKETVSLQVAVALIGKLQHDDSVDVEQAAQAFARSLHNQWGVGESTTCGGAGVVLFLSILDRVAYISTGDALKELLSERRLDEVMHIMKPYLVEESYGEAITIGVDEIRSNILRGKPEWREQILDLWFNYNGLVWIGGVFGLVFAWMRKQEQQKREYAKVKSQLSEIDQAKAKALQGKFMAVSCPICLEDFQVQKIDANRETMDDVPLAATTQPLVGSDELELKEALGSDGLPLKLLRCGHAFDETCWTEWTNSGQGQVDKCPICKTDVGRCPDVLDLSAESTNNTDDTAGMAMRRYAEERSFRLHRLQSRFPRYVQASQVDRWTQSSYDSQLANEPTFIQQDPSHQSHYNDASATRNRSTSGFSGGASGGGRVGRW